MSAMLTMRTEAEVEDYSATIQASKPGMSADQLTEVVSPDGILCEGYHEIVTRLPQLLDGL